MFFEGSTKPSASTEALRTFEEPSKKVSNALDEVGLQHMAWPQVPGARAVGKKMDCNFLQFFEIFNPPPRGGGHLFGALVPENNQNKHHFHMQNKILYRKIIFLQKLIFSSFFIVFSCFLTFLGPQWAPGTPGINIKKS